MQITFMHQTWQVRDALPKELVNCVGLCDPTTNTIIIDKDLPKSVWLQTLAHEFIHVIEMTLHQHLTESQVDVLATGVIHLLKENPWLIGLYMNEEE